MMSRIYEQRKYFKLCNFLFKLALWEDLSAEVYDGFFMKIVNDYDSS